MADVFLSYSRKDIDFMQRTRDYLIGAGLTVWTDESLAPGTPAWTRAIEQAIRAAQLVVVILSPDAKDSDWVERELAIAQDSCRIPIFPILLRGDEHNAIHFRLAVTQFADARRDADTALARLTNSINTHLSRNGTPISLRPAPMPSGSSVVVAKVGAADYRTIGDALKKVTEGMTIVVRPGLYRESLILNKSVEILGEGNREEIILESNTIKCIYMSTDYAEVRGLSIRLRVGDSGKKDYAVDIPKGRLILDDCDISSDSMSCIAIHGKEADPIVRRCIIHHGKSAGLDIYENGRGLIEDCEIFANTECGVSIKTGANPTVRHCKIHDDKQSGVLVWENGTGLIEDCEIFANDLGGIAIRTGGNPIVRLCRLHNSKQVGVLVHMNGIGLIEDCEIFNNAYSGAEIREKSNPTIYHCKINRNIQHGIYVHDNGQGIVENCDLRGNTRSAWLIKEGCVVKKRNNQE